MSFLGFVYDDSSRFVTTYDVFKNVIQRMVLEQAIKKHGKLSICNDGRSSSY